MLTFKLLNLQTFKRPELLKRSKRSKRSKRPERLERIPQPLNP